MVLNKDKLASGPAVGVFDLYLQGCSQQRLAIGAESAAKLARCLLNGGRCKGEVLVASVRVFPAAHWHLVTTSDCCRVHNFVGPLCRAAREACRFLCIGPAFS